MSRAYLLIHVSVVLWGITAILGKIITLPALSLVGWRLLIVLAVLLLVPRTWRGWRAMTPPLRRRALWAGVFVALHWWTFYGAIKLANASVAVAAIAVAPAFLAFVEPAVTGRRFRPRELWLGLAAIPGVWLVVGGSPAGMHLGIAVGLLSALLVAFFSALNKSVAAHADPLALTAVEFSVGAALIGVLGLIWPPAVIWPTAMDWVWLWILALVCTLLPFMMAFIALRELSAWQVQLVVNLEPVYAVALAAIFLGESTELGAAFYAGVTLLVLITLLAARTPRARREAAAGEAAGGGA